MDANTDGATTSIPLYSDPTSVRRLARDAPTPGARVFEIQDDPNGKSSDPEIIQHLTAFVVGDAVNCLSFDDQFPLDDKIRNVVSDQFALVQHLMPFLLIVGNVTQAELHAQAILINLLVQPVAANVYDLEG